MIKKKPYIIPYVGLKNEKYDFEFRLDKEFFNREENALVREGRVTVTVSLDKSLQPHTLDFVIDGTILAECDRCASDIDLPIHHTYRVYVKLESDKDVEADENLEMLYLHPEDQEIDVEPFLYDFTLLSVPFTKRCQDIQKECDPEVTKYIVSSVEIEQEEDNSIDPRWEKLKKLKDLNK